MLLSGDTGKGHQGTPLSRVGAARLVTSGAGPHLLEASANRGKTLASGRCPRQRQIAYGRRPKLQNGAENRGNIRPSGED